MAPSTLLEYALVYAEMGWHIFPLTPGQKIPLPGTHGHLQASCNLDTVRAWWTQRPDANIGLSLEPSGLYVLDVDVAKNKQGLASLQSLLKDLTDEQREEFHTLEATTGRGGAHLFFHANGYPASRRTGFAPGLDLFGSGYVLLAPSVLRGEAFAGAPEYATGTYSWEKDVATPKALPALLAAQIRAPTPVAKSTVSTTETPLDEGGRNTALYRLAATMRDNGMSATAIEAALQVSNMERCNPPLSQHEVSVIAHSAGRNQPSRDVAANAVVIDEFIKATQHEIVLPTPFEQALTTARADVTKALGILASSVAVPLFEHGLDILDAQIEPTPWLVDRLITTGGTVVIGGEPKTSKTWVLCELAIAIATGTKVFDKFDTGEPKKVAYFFAEDTKAAVRTRFVSLCAGHGVDPKVALQNIYMQPRGRFIDLMRDEDLALIIASCRMIGQVDVLILEPLRDIHSGEEDSSDSMGPLFRRIRILGEVLKCTPCVAHHMKKPAAAAENKIQPGQKLRGSSAIHGSVDSGLYLSDLKETTEGSLTVFTNTFSSQVKAAKGAGIFEVSLSIEDGPQGTATRATWRAAGTPQANKDLEDRIINVIRSVPRNEPLTKNQLATTIGGNKTAISRLIEGMADRGVLIRSWRHPKGHELQHPVYTEAPSYR